MLSIHLMVIRVLCLRFVSIISAWGFVSLCLCGVQTAGRRIQQTNQHRRSRRRRPPE